MHVIFLKRYLSTRLDTTLTVGLRSAILSPRKSPCQVQTRGDKRWSSQAFAVTQSRSTVATETDSASAHARSFRQRRIHWRGALDKLRCLDVSTDTNPFRHDGVRASFGGAVHGIPYMCPSTSTGKAFASGQRLCRRAMSPKLPMRTSEPSRV